MHYICSGGGSETKATYHGGKKPGCVFDGFCDANAEAAIFPRWRAFIRDSGYARFDVYPEWVDFSLLPAGFGPDEPHHARLF